MVIRLPEILHSSRKLIMNFDPSINKSSEVETDDDIHVKDHVENKNHFTTSRYGSKCYVPDRYH